MVHFKLFFYENPVLADGSIVLILASTVLDTDIYDFDAGIYCFDAGIYGFDTCIYVRIVLQSNILKLFLQASNLVCLEFL